MFKIYPGVPLGDCPEIPPDEILDGIEDEYASLRPPESEVACGGCKTLTPGCCYQLVGASYLEAARIVATHFTLVTEILPRLAEDALLQLESPWAWEVDASIRAGIPDAEVLQGALARGSKGWFALRKPCPFLTGAGRCGVYSARPDACAGHWLHKSGSPELCVPTIEAEIPVIDTTRARQRLAEHRQNATVHTDDGVLKIPAKLGQGLAMALLGVLHTISPTGLESELRERSPESCERFLELIRKWNS